MKRDFNKWLETFRSSICDYKFYVDFEKVYGNVGNIKVELNILNSLIGSKNIENDFKKLVEEYPKVLNVFRFYLQFVAAKYTRLTATANICLILQNKTILSTNT